MYKPLFLLLAAAAVIAFLSPKASAQLTASKAFASAPQKVFPLLDANTRLDMIDYYNSNLTTPSANKLSGQSRITQITPSTLAVEMSPASDVCIAVLPALPDSVIAVITTLATPTPDSHISFYNAKWQELPADKLFAKPRLADWLTDSGRKNRDEVESMVPFLLVSYLYDPSERTLTLTNNTSKFLSDDVYGALAPYLHPQLTFRWDGKKFAPAK